MLPAGPVAWTTTIPATGWADQFRRIFGEPTPSSAQRFGATACKVLASIVVEAVGTCDRLLITGKLLILCTAVNAKNPLFVSPIHVEFTLQSKAQISRARPPSHFALPWF